MANAPVEVKRAAPAPAGAPDAWRTFRTEMDRLFERFTGGWGMPSLRRVFEAEPAMRYESSFTVPSPAVDVTEDDHAYKVTAELPGMSEKDIEVLVSGDSLMLKGEKRQEREQKGKNFCPSAHTVRFVAASTSLTVWIATRSRRTSSRGCLPLRCPSRLRWWKSRRRSRSSRPPDPHWPRHPRPFLMPWAKSWMSGLEPIDQTMRYVVMALVTLTPLAGLAAEVPNGTWLVDQESPLIFSHAKMPHVERSSGC